VIRQRGFQGQRAIGHLRQLLIGRRYRAGDALPIDVIAAEIGVSRQTVLEAIRILAAEGLVTIIPQVGCHVARHSIEEIGDFFLLFAQVEGLLAGLAARRHHPEDLQRLRFLSREIDAYRAPGVAPADRANGYQSVNRALHGWLHQMARSPETARLAESCWDRSDFHIATAGETLLFSDRLDPAHEEHEAIIAMIEQGNQPAAETLMRNHILGFRAEIMDRLVD